MTDTRNPAARTAAVKRVFWITLGLNLLVAAAKGTYAYASGSLALGADTFHSALDASANVLAIIGLTFSASPADAGHPYGHHKFEILAALGIGVMILLSLLEVSEAAIGALRGHRAPPNIGWTGFVVLGGCMAVNLFVTRYEGRAARALASPLLAADAHHTRADLYGLGAVVLSFLGARAGLAWADGACALLLVLLVGRAAYEVFRDNVPFLVDAVALDPDAVRAAAAIDGVRGVSGVRSRGTRLAVELDLRVQVAADLSIAQGAAIAAAVDARLRAAFPVVSDVRVVVEPARDDVPPASAAR